MSDLLIRDVPPDLRLDLVRAAKENGRSLSAEAIARLQGAVPSPRRQTLRLRFADGPTQGSWRREEIYADDGR